MTKFTPAEEEAITQLGRKLRLTFSQARISKTYIYEITRREKVSAAEILAATDQTNRKVFLQSLFDRRYPETSQLIKNGEWQLCSQK